MSAILRPLIGGISPDWVAAAGTVAAVLVAVGFQSFIWLRERHRTPTLTLAEDREHSHVETDAEGDSVPFIRLRTTNAKGKDSASNVEVLVREVVGSDGSFIRFGSPPLVWTHSEGSTSMAVAPGIRRYVDLGMVTGETHGEATFTLAVKPEPSDHRHVLNAGEYDIRLAVVASNCDATFWDAALAFTGDIDWDSEDDFRQKLTVRVSPSSE
jgi:hypothetical protein